MQLILQKFSVVVFYAIDKGQYEASQVLGLNKWQTTTRVILPQMFRVALPAVANESVTLVKDTALLYAVAVPELLHFAQTAVNRDFTIIPFFFAGAIYLVITLLLTHSLNGLNDDSIITKKEWWTWQSLKYLI